MANMYKLVYFGGTIQQKDKAKLSVASSAVLYGLSVYTVLPMCIAQDGKRVLFRVSDHYKRLVNSSRIIGIDSFEVNFSESDFKNAIIALLNANEVQQDVYVRATVHVDAEIAGTKSRGLSTVVSIFLYDAEPILKADGCRVKTSVWRRIPDYAIPSRAKVNGAYVNSVLAKQDALDSGYDDCVFLDSQGHVCELSAANIFLVRDGVLITPSLTSDLLEGINRKSVMELAKNELNLSVEERTVDLTELYIADEVFASGTSAHISPILEIDSRTILNGEVGKITTKLQKLHEQVRRAELDRYKSWYTIC